MIRTIAIVDDEPEMEDIWSFLLTPIVEEINGRLFFFSDSRDFLEWSDHNPPPEILLCDIDMPSLDGPSLCQKLRQSGHNMEIFFVSGHDPKDYQTVMKQLGISRFITKPISGEEVLAACKEELFDLPANS